METINIENVMDEIRSKILEEGVTADALDFEEVPIPDDLDKESERKYESRRFNREMYYLRTHWKVPIDEPVLSRSKLINFIKKTVKRLTYFQLLPINAAQNDFNASAVKSIYYLNCQLQAKNEEIKSLYKRIEAIEKNQE
jgi:hypothetical protein